MYHIKTNPALCQVVNHIQPQIIYFGRGAVDENWRGEAVNPVNSRLFYIVSGEGDMEFEKGGHLKLEAGNWYLFPAGASFRYTCDSQLDHIYIHLKLCDMDGIDLLHQCDRPLIMGGSIGDADYFTKMLDCRGLLDAMGFRQRIMELLLSILQDNAICLTSRNLSPCVVKAVAYIKSNLSLKLSNTEIARYADVSLSMLSKRFQRELSMSIHDYIENLVFSEAVRMIRESDASIGSISEQFGFCDQFYFSRRFKEKIGTSPRNYRKVFI